MTADLVRPDKINGTAHDRRLWVAGWLFAAGSTVHVVDHLRRGQGSISESLYWLGNLSLILQAVLVTLIITHHRRAPESSVVGGLPLAVGFTAVHWLPEWSVLSDPVWEIGSARWFSYVASLSEILGALGVAIAGVAITLDRRRAGSAPGIGDAGSPTIV